MKILMVGPLPPPLGGTTVLFNNLINHLSALDDVEIDVINTNQIGRSRWFTAASVLCSAIRKSRSANVISFHASASGAFILGFSLCVISRLFFKPFVIRGFGGAYKDRFSALRPSYKTICKKTLFAAAAILMETKESAAFFSDLNQCPEKVHWYPNNRELSPTKDDNHSLACRRMVYISQIKSAKGIHELLQAADLLPELDFDCYGTFPEDIGEAIFEGRNVTYKGVLEPSEVVNTLEEYDALIFPTYYSGEGYPGVVLEAFCARIPVITTRWRCIPEIVDISCGILCEPRNVEELVLAIRRLANDPDLYQALSKGAEQKAQLFSSELWMSKFVEICKNIEPPKD